MIVISCVFPCCEFKSEDVTEAIWCALSQSHSFTHAAAPTAQQDVVLAHERQDPNWRGPTLILASPWKNGTFKLVGGVCSKRAPG